MLEQNDKALGVSFVSRLGMISGDSLVHGFIGFGLVPMARLSVGSDYYKHRVFG